MPRNLIRLLFWLAAATLALVVLAVQAQFQQRLERGAAAHERSMEGAEREFARRRAAREVQAHEENRARERQREEELRLAGGSAADYAVKDPALALTPMFEKLATACAPAGVRTRVQVDRFTEFDVYFDFDAMPDRLALGELTLCVLQRCAPFIHALHISRRGALVTELDVLGIQAVSDWSTVTAAQAAEMLNWETGNRPVSQNSAAPKAGSTGDAVEGDPRYDLVREQYSVHLKAQSDALNAILRYHDEAAVLKPGVTLEQMRRSVAGLKETLTSLGQVKASLRNPLVELESQLRRAGFDELFVRITVRGEREREREAGLGVARERVFAAVEQHNFALQSYPEAMIRHWNRWHVSGDGTRVFFDTEAAESAYSQYSEPVKLKLSQVSEAMAVLNEAVR